MSPETAAQVPYFDPDAMSLGALTSDVDAVKAKEKRHSLARVRSQQRGVWRGGVPGMGTGLEVKVLRGASW
jgi:hypothetical protein